ncbi:MAG TPA: helix-turn-helix domain-containing protein [Acidimicrobiales bacterium]|nr:helix-turn-helix domain-containing protein [Acidimicrobiales bacterium]
MAERPASSYREMAPPPALAEHVECLWIHRLGDGERIYRQPVFPDGRIDLVAVGDDVAVAGPASRPITQSLAPATVTLGVRFRPGAAPALLGAGAPDLRDRDTALDDLWGRDGAALAERFADTARWRDRLQVLVDHLTGRLAEARALDPVAVGVAAALADEPGRPVAELASRVGLSERQLRRRVEDAVGHPPRTLARILRFQRFLDGARAAGPERDLARLAAETGYADQPHLTRESRRLGGLPPGALLAWEADRLAG